MAQEQPPQNKGGACSQDPPKGVAVRKQTPPRRTMLAAGFHRIVIRNTATAEKVIIFPGFFRASRIPHAALALRSSNIIHLRGFDAFPDYDS